MSSMKPCKIYVDITKKVYENHPEKIDHKQIQKHGVKILKVPN